MRTAKQLPTGTPIETDLTKFPDSTIVNETETAPGTPVVRELYGDILTNQYKILRRAGLVPNGIEDNELNGYQLADALQQLPNKLNVEQPLNLSGTVFSVNLNISLLPAKFLLVCRAAEAYTSGVTYTFQGTDASPLPFSSVSAFNSGDEVLLVVDPAGVRAYNLTAFSTPAAKEAFTPFGTPLAFNDSNKIWYESQGILFSDLPEAYDLQSAIRVLASDGTIQVYEMMVTNGFVICLTLSVATTTYKFYKFALTSLSTPVAMTMSGATFPTGTDHQPYVYTDGTHMYITNHTGNSTDNSAFDIFTLNATAGTLTYTGTVELDSGFGKTTNAVTSGGNLFTFIAGNLNKYNLGTGAVTFVNAYPTYLGVVFGFNGGVYYSNGEVAKKWTL
jgi:hypothetical protein